MVLAGKVKVVKLKSERSCGGGRGKTSSSLKYSLSRDAKFVLRNKWTASKTTSYRRYNLSRDASPCAVSALERF